MKWFELGPFTVFDVETTGMSPVASRIVEIAAVRIGSDGSRRSFHSLVNPGRKIPRGVIGIHHIDDQMVCGAPDFSRIGMKFLEFASGTTLVAHNAKFDLGFLQESLNRAGLPLWEGKTLDSLRLIRKTHPGLPGYSLGFLREYFALESTPEMQAHRAGDDVEWTCRVLEIALTAALAATAGSRK